MKKVWITSLQHNENNIKSLIAVLQPYYIPVDGHFWIDDLPKMAWSGVKDSLIDFETGLWVIVANKSSWSNKSILKGLSSLAIVANAGRKSTLPILILTEDFTLELQDIPTPLAQAKILPLNQINLGVKISALLNMPQPTIKTDYRINFHPLHELGLWIEIGPNEQTWSGMIFGVNSGEITFQACGQALTLPEKCVLEYPQQGLELTYSDMRFVAWGIQNIIDSNSSYFARLSELSEQILFTSYTTDSETEAYLIKLC